MADFTTANLEGANELLNKTLTDALALKDQLVASHGDDATALLNSLQSKVADLESSLLNMIPELPTVPNVNMQGEFAGLADIDISTPAGLEQYTTQVANITSQFGTAMADKGLDIDSLASKIQTGGDVGDLLPNLQLPDGESLPIELPANISLPSVEAVTETISKTSKDGVSLVTEEIKVSVEESPGYTKVTKTVTKTTTTNPKTVTNTTTKEKLRVSDTGGETKSWRSSETQEERDKAYREDLLAEYKKNRTILPGFYEDKTYRGVPLPLQRFSDSYIQSLHERANGYETLADGKGGVFKHWQDPPERPYLSKGKTLRLFQSATYDKGIEDGLDEEIAFKDAQYEGDWDWKKDADGRIYYDRRYKKLKLV